ncbi:MAG: PKD domain-containing protein [Bacteroidota bacterium]
MRGIFLIILFILFIFCSCQKEPIANFSLVSTTACTGEEINIINISDDAYDWLWDFGDSTTSTDENPYHTYNHAGKYKINLTAYSKNGKKTASVSKDITILTSTKDFITGTWKLNELYDDLDILLTHIITDVNNCYVKFNENGSITSTTGPLFMYIAFGFVKYNIINDTLDYFFNYNANNLTTGTNFIEENSISDHLCMEYKIAFNNINKWNYLISSMGLQPPSLVESAIYFKYSNILLEFSESNPDEMIWKFTTIVNPQYTIKDSYGEFILWPDINSTNLSLCTIVFERTDSLIIN